MPPLPSVASVVRADFHFTLTGDFNAQFRKFFKYGGVLSGADAQTWVTAMRTAWSTRLAPIIHTDCSLILTTLTDLSSASAAQAQDATTVAGANATGGLLPNGTAVVIKSRIARRYRGGHPKIYMPGWPPANLATSDAWGAAAMALLLTDWNLFISDILTNVPALAAPATEVNVSYFSGFTVSAPPGKRAHNIPTPRLVPVVDTILSHSINPAPASQRRRNENP